MSIINIVGAKNSYVKSIANTALAPFGLCLVRQSALDAAHRRATRLVTELCGVYLTEIFPEIPDCGGRLQLVQALIGTEVPEAMFMLHYLHAALASGAGDVVEMGVAQGATSTLLANEIRSFDERNLWLYDSFRGLSAPTGEDNLIDDIEHRGSMDAYQGAMANPQHLVEARLESISFPAERLNIIAGFVGPEMPAPEKVAFAYLDFDLYQPISTGLAMLHPSTRAGSVLMIDDYGFFSSGVEAAVKGFFHLHPDQYHMYESPSYAGNFCVLVRR
jgi:O-methyltransferase